MPTPEKNEKSETKAETAPPAVAAAPRERDPARDKAIDLAVSTIEKQFGKGSIMRLGEEMAPPEVKVVPTGSLGLDIALGVGGLPRGRVVEIYGPESSGKTTLALHVVGEAQKLGGICAFVDAEHALDVGYARKLGVRTDDLLVSQPDCGEQALEITEMLVRSGAVDVIVVDSVAALTPEAELEGEMGDAHVGLQARLMSQALRKLTGTISKSNTLVIFINQIRMKIGVMFGNPETTTGGNALKFYASVPPGHPADRRAQGRREGRRQPHAGQGGEEQDGAAVPRGRVRHPVRRGHQPRGRPGRPRQRVRRGREVGRLVRLRRASASARGATTPSSSCAITPTWRARSRSRCSPTTASSATSARPAPVAAGAVQRAAPRCTRCSARQPKPVSDKRSS